MSFNVARYGIGYDADRDRLINYLQEAGFYKEGEVSFPHKQSAVMRIKREYWDGPAI